MTSKEALIKLVGKTGIINDTCASLKDCIKGCKCRFNEPKKECDDYNLVMTIKKDLKRLEQLEKALDILKKFNFTIFNTKDNNNELAFRIYTDSLLETQSLNKEEYLLLKEVLGNE